jgi:hypothetical protein
MENKSKKQNNRNTETRKHGNTETRKHGKTERQSVLWRGTLHSVEVICPAVEGIAGE